MDKQPMSAAAEPSTRSPRARRDWHARFAPPPVPCGEDAAVEELRQENKRDRDFTAEAPHRK